MDVVEFRREVEELGVGAATVISPFVNGVKLQELVREVELPFARAEKNAELAGSYAGLIADDGLRAAHYLDEPMERSFGDTVLLGCVCGHALCWPLSARIALSAEAVTWSGFRTGHRRDWDLSDLGPFTFERPAYESALATAFR
jgi:hypothetical protein